MSDELRELPEVQVREILSAHRKWVDSNGKEGARAELTKVNLQRWNFSNARLERSLLTGTDIQQSTLIGAQLQEADLAQANLFGANFEDADLQHANLRQANLKTTVLLRTNLRDADFQDADLLGAKGLQAGQLGGTNLSGTQLPHYLGEFAGLTQVEELSKSAKKLFISILLGCAYCWLTIFSTNDAQLLTNSTSTPLPIIQAPIPIAGFYGVAPFVLLSLFIYFHLYLQRLWRELAGLPAVFPDGKPLDEKAHPWLLNSLLCAHVPRLKINRPPLSRLEVGLSILLGWWLVPFTATLFWLRALQRHDWVLTGFQVAWAITAILCAAWFYRLAKLTLSGQQPMPIRFKGNWMRVEPYKETAKRFGTRAALGILTAFPVLIISDGAINAERAPENFAETRLYQKVSSGNSIRSHRIYVPALLRLVWARATADLKEQDISTKPQNWFLREDADLPRIVHGAQLKKANLRLANAEGAFLMKADLREANLQEADLHNAFLQEADLSSANLQGANLSQVHLQGATLGRAILRKASLVYANLKGAKLSETNLQGARLGGANLEEASLVGASLQKADLQGSKLKGATLVGAALQDAMLFGANLQGADMGAAELQGADLAGANLQGTNLVDATLEGARLSRALPEVHGFIRVQLEGADLRFVKGLTQDQINQACVDKKTRLPNHLKKPKPCRYR